MVNQREVDKQAEEEIPRVYVVIFVAFKQAIVLLGHNSINSVLDAGQMLIYFPIMGWYYCLILPCMSADTN